MPGKPRSNRSNQSKPHDSGQCTHMKVVQVQKCKQMLKKKSKVCRACSTARRKGKKIAGDDGDIWMCMACGLICCGTDSQDHALLHFKSASGHSLFVSLSTETFVTCYACEMVIDLSIESKSVSLVRNAVENSFKISSQPPSSKPKEIGEEKTDLPISTAEISAHAKEGDQIDSNEGIPVGLSNLGATCYFNSVLQCLLISKMRIPCIQDPNTQRFRLLTAYSSLVEDISRKGGRGAYNPKRLLSEFANFHPQFTFNEQMDAHEFFIKFLETVGNERKKLPEPQDGDGMEIKFRGEFENCVICERCGSRSFSSQQFLNLVVPCSKAASPLLGEESGLGSEETALLEKWSSLSGTPSALQLETDFKTNTLEHGLCMEFLPDELLGDDSYDCDKCSTGVIDEIGGVLGAIVISIVKDVEGTTSLDETAIGESIVVSASHTTGRVSNRSYKRRTESRASKKKRKREERKAGRRKAKSVSKRGETSKETSRREVSEGTTGTAAMRRINLKSAPEVLVIQLNRFTRRISGRIAKDRSHMKFPFRLNLSFLGIEDRFILIGVVVHSGSQNFGHYISHINTARVEEMSLDGDSEGIWHTCNDNYITNTSLERVLQSEAYLLFYSRVHRVVEASSAQK